MTTAFLGLANAVVAGLLQAPAIAGGRVGLPQRVPVPAEWDSYVEVRCMSADGARTQMPAGAPMDWSTAVVLDLYARAAPGGQAHVALDDLLSAVHERMAGMAFSGLEVIDIDSNPRIDWDTEQGATPYEQASYVFIVRHRVRGAGLQPS